MSTHEALETYASIAGAIFSSDNKNKIFRDGMFKASTLEKNVRSVVARRLHGQKVKPGHVGGDVGNDLMRAGSEERTMGKAFVCAMPALNMAYPRRFRTYRVREHINANCAIWEAARATTAAPTFFERISIGESGYVKEDFIDAGLGCNNPVLEVMDEAAGIFGNSRPIGCIVSLGTGHPGIIGLAKPDTFQKLLPTQLVDVLKRIATDCQNTARGMDRRFATVPDVYFRFDVTHGAGTISLEEWKRMGDVVSHTRAYLQDVAVDRSIDTVVDILLRNRRSTGVCLGHVC